MVLVKYRGACFSDSLDCIDNAPDQVTISITCMPKLSKEHILPL